MQGRLHVFCSYSETDISTVLKYVARTRLGKTEKPSACVTVNSKLFRLAIARPYYL
jgi:hypothetical protein